MVGVVLGGQRPTRGLQEEVVDHLVDAVVAAGEPVVDSSQVLEDPTRDSRLLGDLANRCLLGGLTALQVALGKAPLQASAPVAPGDDGDCRPAPLDLHDEPAGTGLVHYRQVSRTAVSRRYGGAG